MAFVSLSAFFSLHFIEEHRSPAKNWSVVSRFLSWKESVSKKGATQWITDEYVPRYQYYYGYNPDLGGITFGGTWGNPNDVEKQRKNFVAIYHFDSPTEKQHFIPSGQPWGYEIRKVLANYKSKTEQFFGKYLKQNEHQLEDYMIVNSDR